MAKIRRDLFNDLLTHLEAKEISLIVGPRQAGKTTLMKDLRDYLESKGERTLFFNLDFEPDNVFFKTQEGLIRRLDLEFGQKRAYVFIDEIQRKENAGLFLKGLYDYDLPYKLIVSGSGSLDLKEKIHESLAGRKRLFELTTVSFREFVDFSTEYRYSDRLEDFMAVDQARLNCFLIDYLNFGGYPRVILEKELAEKARVMNEIYRSYVEKDIAYFLGVNRVDAFSLLIRILASQTGQILKYSKLAQESGLSTLTLKNYLWYAERTFSIRLLSPYFKNKHKEIIKAPSVYFYDLGMRNFSLNSFGGLLMPDYLGFVFQNFIANLLQAKIMYTAKSLNFWRTIDMAEVDFVINSSSDILPIEVKYSCLKKPEVTRSLRSFILRYAPSEAWVVNLSLEAEMIIGNTKVRFIPYYTIALNPHNMV